MKPDRLLIATTTVSTPEQADTIAQTLLASRLAACVQIDGPITSHYVWQGRLEQSREWRLTIKSRTAVSTNLRQKVLDIHPFEVPQWTAVVCENVADGYWQWVQQSVPNDPPK
jgi:periplasmic divalent cation tolerance protein